MHSYKHKQIHQFYLNVADIVWCFYTQFVWFGFHLKELYRTTGLENVMVHFKVFEHGWKPCEYFVIFHIHYVSCLQLHYTYKTMIIDSVTILATLSKNRWSIMVYKIQHDTLYKWCTPVAQSGGSNGMALGGGAPGSHKLTSEKSRGAEAAGVVRGPFHRKGSEFKIRVQGVNPSFLIRTVEKLNGLIWMQKIHL